MAFCFKCGNELQEGAAFCSSCGTRVDDMLKKESVEEEKVHCSL